MRANINNNQEQEQLNLFQHVNIKHKNLRLQTLTT